jgi:hypothetical protein
MFVMQSRMTLEQPLSQERNKHEVAAIFRVVRVLVEGPMDNSARKAVMVLLLRAKEVGLMESSGVKYASTFASHIQHEAESSILSAAHSAALLADKRGNNQRTQQQYKSSKKSGRHRKDKDKSGDGDKPTKA